MDFYLISIQLSDDGHPCNAKASGYLIRKGVEQKQLTLPLGGENRLPEKRKKGYCNACWHPRKSPYTHSHCSRALRNAHLPDEQIVELILKISNK